VNTTETALATRPAELLRPIGTAEAWKEGWNQYQDAKKFLVDRKHDLLIIKARDGEEDREFLRKGYWRKASSFFGLSVTLVGETERYIACDAERCPIDCKGEHYEVLATYRATYRTGQCSDGDGSCIDNEKWTPVTKERKASRKQLDYLDKLVNDAQHLCELTSKITAGATSNPFELTMSEASALIEWQKNDCQGEPVIVAQHRPRNSRHNVRGTAHTRAYNRAVSNLIGGGEVSAEELIIDAEVTEETPTADEPKPTAKTKTTTQPNGTSVADTITLSQHNLIDMKFRRLGASDEDMVATCRAMSEGKYSDFKTDKPRWFAVKLIGLLNSDKFIKAKEGAVR